MSDPDGRNPAPPRSARAFRVGIALNVAFARVEPFCCGNLAGRH